MNKRKLLIVIGIFLCLSVLISVSYAYYIFNVSQNGVNALRTDCFRLEFNDANSINLQSAIPLTEEEGSATTPYTFTIKNVCNKDADYTINLETINNSTIDLDAVRFKLNNRRSKILGDMNDLDSSLFVNNNVSSSKTLYTDYLTPNESKTFNFRVWIDEEATAEQSANKTFESKIVVISTIKTTYNDSILASGETFNRAIRELSNEWADIDYEYGSSGYEYYSSTDDCITDIIKSTTPPPNGANVINVASESSAKPIYAWYEDGDEEKFDYFGSAYYPGIIYLYTENDTIKLSPDCKNLFRGLAALKQIDLSYFDTSNVTTMESMFSENGALEHIDLSTFDTSNVTNMSLMFQLAENLHSINLSYLDTSNVTDTHGMFAVMRNITSLDLSPLDTSNVTDMSHMFYYLDDLENLDISHLNTSNVTDMSYMFFGTDDLTNIDVSNLNTSNVTNMSYMFSWMNKLSTLDLSNFNTSNVESMSYMFDGSIALSNINLSSFDTSNVTHMDGMFSATKALRSVNLSNFNTSNVTSMIGMFSGAGLSSVDLSNFNTSKVTNMAHMFFEAKWLTNLDLSGFDTSNVTDMLNMFYKMSNLVTLDISSFNTNNVRRYGALFMDDINLKTIYVGSDFVVNTSINQDKTDNSYYDRGRSFDNVTQIVGGAGTVYSTTNPGRTYLRIDCGTSQPGYLTYKGPIGDNAAYCTSIGYDYTPNVQ